MAIQKRGPTAISISVAFVLATLASSTALAVSHTAASRKSRICLVLPKAQLGQGNSGIDVAEPVRQTLAAYLSGPNAEIQPINARIPMQIDAEAQQSGCDYVLYTSVVQTQKKSSGFGKLFTKAAPIAGMFTGVGGLGGDYGAVMATQAVTSAVTAAAAQSAQEEAMAALTGATQSNIRKGDQVTFEYKLLKPGVATPIETKSEVAKAKENGEDLLSPLIEQIATAVLTVTH